MSDPIAFPAIDLMVILQSAIVFGWAIALLVIDLFIPRDRKQLTGYLALLGLIVAAVADGIPVARGLPVDRVRDGQVRGRVARPGPRHDDA